MAVAVALALAAGACGSSNDSGGGSGKLGGSINGAGATFPAPVYQQWASNVKQQKGLIVNYNGIGSGGGIAQFTAGTVDFGATDAAMTDAEVKAAIKKGEPVHVPTVFGAVTVAYHVAGVPTGLKLDGPTIADIFAGSITRWNDSAIARLNPGVKLPSEAITVVHRSDASGTTKLFTSFLAETSPAWAAQVGSDKTVRWPTGTGAKGNDGVAAAIKQTDGSVGYVEQAYALANNFSTAAVKNRAGHFIAPSLSATSAAGEGLNVPSDLRFSAVNAPGVQAYPIASATFILVYQDPCRAGLSPERARGVKAYLDYGLGAGQSVATQLQYAPLPTTILGQAKGKVAGLTCNGAPISA